MSRTPRVVALIDMDCFYCACERALDKDLVGIPLAVLQYNPFAGDGKPGAGGVASIPPEPASARVVARGGKVLIPSAVNGSIIAVSYEARAKGVTRFFRGREALSVCPELVLVVVPTAHGKSDMGLYRGYGAQTLKIISEVCGQHGPISIEKASVDEMYVDLTAPARARLASESHAALFGEGAAAGTHVAGAAEGADEAGRGAQPTGVLARNSFRAGHAGQIVKPMDAASEQWWCRSPPEWPEEEALFAAGAAIVCRARAEVTHRLGFTCSAGIAANKLLAKLCGGLHKPDQQTVPRDHSLLMISASFTSYDGGHFSRRCCRRLRCTHCSTLCPSTGCAALAASSASCSWVAAPSWGSMGSPPRARCARPALPRWRACSRGSGAIRRRWRPTRAAWPPAATRRRCKSGRSRSRLAAARTLAGTEGRPAARLTGSARSSRGSPSWRATSARASRRCVAPPHVGPLHTRTVSASRKPWPHTHRRLPHRRTPRRTTGCNHICNHICNAHM